MNVCVYELGSMSGARDTSRGSATTATINFFFFFTKERFEFLNAIYNGCLCVCCVYVLRVCVRERACGSS